MKKIIALLILFSALLLALPPEDPAGQETRITWLPSDFWE